MKEIIEVFKSYPRFWRKIMTYNIIMVISSYFVGLGLAELKGHFLLKKEYDFARENNPKEYVELYDAYDQYIEEIVKIIKSFNNDDLMFVYSLYQNMMANSFFSYGDNVSFGEPKVEFFDNEGISVVYGDSVCRNRANHLKDVLCKFGYDAQVSYGEVYYDEPEDETNHAVVYVRSNGVDYLLDPTHNTFYLRDSMGKYVCCDNVNKGFVPDRIYDNIALTEENDWHLYYSMTKDFNQADELFRDFQEYSKIVSEYYNILECYEQENILPLEKEIVKILTYCQKNGLNVNE